MKLDGRRGEKKVQCFRADRELAVRVAKTIRAKLCSLGLDMVEAVLVVRDERGTKAGDHDLVLEVVSDGRGGVPTASHPSGYISAEVKLRRLWSESGRQQTRKDVQRESADECAWWLQESSKLAGRMIIMAIFTQKEGDDFEVRGDLKLNGETRWRSVFGWSDGVQSIAPPTQRPAARASAKTVAAPKRRTGPSRNSSSSRVAAPAPGMSSAVVEQLVFRGGVAEVKSLLRKVRKNPTKAHYWAHKAKERHLWNDQELYQMPRSLETSTRGAKRQRVGGSGEWVATKPVCKQMCKDWFGA